MDHLQTLLTEGLAAGLYLGACYRVFQLETGTLAEGAAGWAQEEPRVPATLSTIWDLASITKAVATATSVLILAQEGAFELDEDVSRFLPGDPEPLEGITLQLCLTHISGLRPWEQLHSQGLSREAIVARVRALGADVPPGERYAYSDMGYILLGAVVEAVSGRSLAELAHERIFAPLGMSDTGYLPGPDVRGRLAATYCGDRQRVLLGEVHDGNCDALGGVAGHAGLFGTAGDLETYARMLLGKGTLNGRRILAPLAARQMVLNQNPPNLNGHTLGWFTRPNGYLPAGDFLPEDTFGHTGFTGTSLLLSPSLGLGVVLLTNRVYQQRDGKAFLRFRRRFHNAVAGSLE